MRRVLRWRREGVAWRARGNGVSGQRKGRRRVLILVLRPLLPIIFPHGHRFLLRFVHVDAAASAMEFLQSHRLFQVRNRASGAAAAVFPRP